MTAEPTPNNQIIPFRRSANLPAVRNVDVYGAVLADARTPTTLRARKQDLSDLARFLELPGASEAADLVVAGTAGQANIIALGYRQDLMRLRLSAATVNRRLSTLRRLVKLARRLGIVDWALDVDGLKTVPYRDTTGPGDAGWRKLVAATTAGDGAKACRDRAIIRLLHDNALRRGELVAMDLADLDLQGGRIAIVGKGKTERAWLTLNTPTAAALRTWLVARGTDPGPLFLNFQPGRSGGRLTADGVYYMVVRLGKLAELGRAVRPHGLRHQAITKALDLTGGNVRAVQRFSRHAKTETLLRYDDQREDLAGQVSGLLGLDA